MLFLEKIGDCICSKPGETFNKHLKPAESIISFTRLVKALLCLILATVFCVLIVVCLGSARKIEDYDCSSENVKFAPTPKKNGIITLHYKNPKNVRTWTNKIQTFLKSKKTMKFNLKPKTFPFQSTKRRKRSPTRSKSAAASTNTPLDSRPAKSTFRALHPARKTRTLVMQMLRHASF